MRAATRIALAALTIVLAHAAHAQDALKLAVGQRGNWENAMPELGQKAGNTRWFEMSERIEALIKSEKKLFPNVDFYSASTYYTMGIAIDLYTPIFAVSRISGWTAHVLEQLANNRLIRPRADYTGPTYPQTWIPVENR